MLPKFDDDGCWGVITGKEAMTPAWLVPKMTSRELKQRNHEIPTGATKHEFNVELKPMCFKVFCQLTSESCPSSRELGGEVYGVIVPIMTTAKDVKKGDSLIMQCDETEKTHRDRQLCRG